MVDKDDPSSFFRISILEQEHKVHFANLDDQFSERAFLPSQIASKISLNKNDLQRIFPQSFVNPHAKGNFENTLLYCNSAALKGETKSCPKSLEDMIEFSKTTLGSKQLVALTAKSTKGSRKEVTIGKIKIYTVDVVEPETKVPVNTVHAVYITWIPHHGLRIILHLRYLKRPLVMLKHAILPLDDKKKSSLDWCRRG